MMSGLERTDPAVKALRPRLWGPHQVLADETFVVRVQAMGLAPWEVITSNELARCADITPRTLADWRWSYAGVLHLPEPEPMGRYTGKTLYYRVDALLDWHAGQGERPVRWELLWEQGAAELAKNHLGNFDGPQAVNGMLDWCWCNQILSLRLEPNAKPFQAYTAKR